MEPKVNLLHWSVRFVNSVQSWMFLYWVPYTGTCLIHNIEYHHRIILQTLPFLLWCNCFNVYKYSTAPVQLNKRVWMIYFTCNIKRECQMGACVTICKRCIAHTWIKTCVFNLRTLTSPRKQWILTLGECSPILRVLPFVSTPICKYMQKALASTVARGAPSRSTTVLQCTSQAGTLNTSKASTTTIVLTFINYVNEVWNDRKEKRWYVTTGNIINKKSSKNIQGIINTINNTKWTMTTNINQWQVIRKLYVSKDSTIHKQWTNKKHNLVMERK